MEIKALVKRVQQGNTEDFRQVVRHYQAKLLNFTMNMTRDIHQAKDLCQETFIKAYTGIGDFDEDKASFTTWLYTIARNKCISHLRQAGSPKLVDLQEEHLCSRPGQDSRELYESLDRLLRKEPEKRRTAFELVVVQGLSCEEAGEVLGVPTGTVKSRVHKVRQLLIQSMEKPGVTG